MDKEISDLQGGQKTLWTDVNLLEDRMMDVEMSASGAHHIIGEVKDDVRDLNDLAVNINNQVERIQVEDILWCWSRILSLEKPNNPANKSLWQLVNHLSHWIEDQEDLIKDLQAGLVGAKDRVSVLEMSSAMIRLRVTVLEEAMEIDPPMMDLSGEDDSTNSEYANVDDGGAMLVDDSEDERDQENVVPIPVPPLVIRLDTPRPPTVLRELIPIEEPAPIPAVEVEEGEDDAWFIPPVMHHWVHPLNKFTTAAVEPVPEYVKDRRDDPVPGPSQDDLAVDGSEDEMWANLGVNRRATLAE